MKPSWFARVLLALLRGPGSEYLKGDLDEWRAEEQQRRNAGLRPRSFEVEVARSLVAWLRPRTPAGVSPIAWIWRLLRGAFDELKHAVRTLARRPGYALLVIGVMGVGIGASTTVLTVADRVLVRTLPFTDAERLTVIGNTFPDREWRDDAPGLQHLAGFSLANFEDWEDRTQLFERLAGVEQMSILLSDRGSGPEIVQSSAVTPDFFDLLHVRPALGRLFLPDEYRSAADPVVVLSHSAWVTRYGADPDVVGTTLDATQGGTTIVGVLPPNFEVPRAVAAAVPPFWFPIRLDSDRYADRGRRGLSGIGLMRRGVTVDEARVELATIGAGLADDFPDGNVYPDGRRLGVGTNALQAHTIGGTRRPIMLFAGASVLLLLISGLNASNLTLVRGLGRASEIGVRRALGAGRFTLVRLFVVETLLLAAAGGLVGLAIAHGGVAAFRRLGPSSIPRMAEVHIDGRIALLAVLITAGAGLLTGLIPALRLTGRGTELGGSGSRATVRLGAWSWPVATQVAVSMLLMVSAGLLMQSFMRLRSFDPGFNPSSALVFQQGLKRPGTGDLETHQLWDELLDHIDGVPGYTAVAAASNLPFQSPNWAPWVLLPEDSPESHRTGIAGYVVSIGFFGTLGIPLIRGRSFERSDGPDAQPVALVNQAFVETHSPNRDVVGTTLRLRRDATFTELRVVGVVGNTVQSRPEDGLGPALYVPYTQTDWPSAWVFARASGDPLAGVATLRRRVADINPYVPPRNVATMRDRIGTTHTGPRFNAALAMTFGLVSLLLSAGGLYGALSFGVGRRLKEIGVRMALGATRRSVLNLVLLQGLRVTLAGIGVGLALALLGGRLIRAFLFDIEPTSVTPIAAVTLGLVAVAVLACLAPAVRATRVDPTRSLTAD